MLKLNIEVGVKGMPEGELLRKITFFEVDALDPELRLRRSRTRFIKRLASHQKLALSLNHYFLRGRDTAESLERVRLALELFTDWGAHSISIRVPSSFIHSLTIEETLHLFFKEFTHAGVHPPRVDADFQVQSPLELIGDPVWSDTREEFKRKEWRIHGYHHARWIRMYSEEVLMSLARSAQFYRPERILFAHSQRFLQSQAFVKFLAKTI